MNGNSNYAGYNSTQDMTREAIVANLSSRVGFLAGGSARLGVVLLIVMLALVLATQVTSASDELGGADGSPGVDRTVALAQNLVDYLDRDQLVQYCNTEWMGHPVTTTTTCEVLNESFLRTLGAIELLPGDFIWVEFTPEDLNFAELMTQWGMPELVRSDEGSLSFSWETSGMDVAGRMYWGDPHEIPARAILTLEAVDR